MNRAQLNSVIKILLPVTSEIAGAPKHSATIQNYVSRNPNKGEIFFYTRVEPGTEKSIPDFFSPSDKFLHPSYFLAELKKGRVWGRNGAVIGDGDYFISDVSREFNNEIKVIHSVFHTLRQVKCQKLQGKVSVIGTAGAYVYYHWMLDILPRLGLLSSKLPLDEIDYFITEFTHLTFQVETLKRIGIPLEKIIASNENWNFHVKANTLYVPSLVGPIGQPTSFQVNYLKKLFSNCISDRKPFRKIYISRRETGRRHIVNEEELLSFLVKYQFEIINCEKLSVREQVLLFSEAAIVIGSHGSAFTNLVFSKPGTIVIDIFNESHTNPCFWIISKLLDLNYYHFAGISSPIDNNPKNDNTIIDIERFKLLFDHTLNRMIFLIQKLIIFPEKK